MKRRRYIRALAAGLALLLCWVALGEENVEEPGRELGDVLLVDPSAGEGAVVPDSGQASAPKPVAETTAKPVSAQPPEGEELVVEVDAPAPEPSEPDVPESQAPQTEGGQADDAGDGATGDPPQADAGTEETPAVSAPEASEQPDGAPAGAKATCDLTLGVGEKATLKAEGADFLSDRPEVAAVDARKGVVTAVSEGRAVVTATGGKGEATRWNVEVLKAPDAVILSDAKLTLGAGETCQLTASLPKGTSASEIRFSSSKKSVVTVDRSGRLKAKKAGAAVITASVYNGVKAKCSVRVLAEPKKVTLSPKALVLCVGETAALKARLSGKSASRLTWASDDAGVVTVDDSGGVKAVGPGETVVSATAFNGKNGTCAVTVLAGKAPTTLALDAKKLTLGAGEKLRLSPAVGEGEQTVFSFASSKPKVAKVSAGGQITAKKKGTATVTVTTHNGLKAKLTVKVVEAPSRVTLSRNSLSMRVGESARLSAWVSTGASSAFTWSSSDGSVATVDGDGNITALKPGKVRITVKTYNKKSRSCEVTVTENGPSVEDDPGTDTTVDDGETSGSNVVSGKRMISNLRKSGALGSKRDAIVGVVELLMDNGFEPAFAAGVAANIQAEGTYGLFESSRYISNPRRRPRYFCYLDGGEYYTTVNGESVLTAVYLSAEELETYDGEAEARLRFGEENLYLNNYSRKYAWDVDLNELEALLEALAEGNWEGKFGLGIVQWTGPRTKRLVALYRKRAGSGNRITSRQVIAAENEMILNELKGGYGGVYSAWKRANKGKFDTAEAARSAGALVCTKYEIPADKNSKAVARGKKAAQIYKSMVG